MVCVALAPVAAMAGAEAGVAILGSRIVGALGARYAPDLTRMILPAPSNAGSSNVPPPAARLEGGSGGP